MAKNCGSCFYYFVPKNDQVHPICGNLDKSEICHITKRRRACDAWSPDILLGGKP